jgi:uncharacterized membrane protein
MEDGRVTRLMVVTATVLLGLSAGLFATFSYAVMPGLRRTDDGTFIRSMRAINAAILNPVLVVVLVGAALATAAAIASAGGSGARPWLVAALALHVVGACVVTAVVNVPLNDLLAAGAAGPGELRDGFERRWVAANHLRSALTVTATAFAVVAATRL